MSRVERDPLTIVAWWDAICVLRCSKCAQVRHQARPVYVGDDSSRERCEICHEFCDMEDLEK
jgi:hypothetical protein